MIKKTTVKCVFAGILCLPAVLFAIGQSHHTDQIALYDKKDAKTPRQYLDLSTQLIPIVQQGGWIKVGVRPSGDVGWINIKQYEQAKHNHDQPQSQSFSVSITRDQSGKEHRSITAYRNGKKLSDAEANELYQSFQSTPRSSLDPWFEAQQRMLNTMSDTMQGMMIPPSMPYTVEQIPELKPLPKQE